MPEPTRRSRAHLCSATGVFHDDIDGVRRAGVDGAVGAERTSERKFLLAHVDGHDAQTHRLGVLDAGVT
jgi:hypothetical protein